MKRGKKQQGNVEATASQDEPATENVESENDGSVARGASVEEVTAAAPEGVTLAVSAIDETVAVVDDGEGEGVTEGVSAAVVETDGDEEPAPSVESTRRLESIIESLLFAADP